MKTKHISTSSPGQTHHPLAAELRQTGWILTGRSRAVTSILSRMIAALLAFVPAGHAGIMITAGNADGSAISATPGSYVDVPVSVANFAGVSSMQFTLVYEPTVLSYQSVTVSTVGGVSVLPGLTLSMFGTPTGNPYHTDPGVLTLAWNDPDELPEGRSASGAIFTVRLNAIGTSGSTSPLTFVSEPTAQNLYDILVEEIPDVSWNSGSVAVVPEPVSSALAVVGSLAVALWTGRVLKRRFFRGSQRSAQGDAS